MLEQVISNKAGWTRVAFGDVVRKVNDKTDPWKSGLERYVAGDHMVTDDLQIRRWGTIGDDYLGPAFHMRFKPGHVLYGSRRTYLRKVALADFEGITANTTYVLDSKDPLVLMPELLPFIMQTEAFHANSIARSKGSVNPYVNFSDLACFEFSLPPIQEQARLVDVMKAVEVVSEGHIKTQTALRTLLASLIDSTAAKGLKAGSAVPLEKLVHENRPICYGILMPGTGHYGGVPVIKVRDYPDGEIIEEGLLLTSPELDEEYQRSRLQSGDLIISIRGTVGRLAVVPESLDKANITQDTARLSLKLELNPDFIRAMLESTYVQRQIASFIVGLAVKGINIGELRRIIIPVVSRTEQDDLVREISEIRARQISLNERVVMNSSLKKLLLKRNFGLSS